MFTPLIGGQKARGVRRVWLCLAVLSLLAAGALHLGVAREHYDHAQIHAVFLAVAGVLEIVWGLLFLRRPSRMLALCGMGLAGGLVALWGLTRVFAPPFGEGPKPVTALFLHGRVTELGGSLIFNMGPSSSVPFLFQEGGYVPNRGKCRAINPKGPRKRLPTE